MPPAALVRISVRTPSRPRTRVANVDRPEVVPLVEVRPPRRARRRACPPTAPTTSVPAWPITAEAGQFGNLAVRNRRRVCCSPAAKSPSPDPSTMATSGTLADPAAQRLDGLLGTLVRSRRSQQEPRDRRGDEVGERAGQHRAQPEARQVVPARRRQRADAADLDADRAEVREAAQRERRDGERAGIERRASSGRAASRRRTR